MNRKLTLAFSLVALLCLGMAMQTYAQTRVLGVAGGDELIYDVKSYWTSQDPSATVPAELSVMNETDNFTIKITIVSDPNVTTTQLWNFVNETQQPYLVSWNVETGESYHMISPFEGIVGANLAAGDMLHPLGNDTITINQTTTRSYASGDREINVVEIESPIIESSNNGTTQETIGNRRIAFYLDKETGVLVESSDEAEYFDSQETGSVVWTLKETNLWSVSADSGNNGDTDLPIPLPVLIGIVVVVVGAIVAIVFLKGRPRRRRH